MDAIDPVTLVVVQNGLQQVASEMDLTFERAAFSPVISEGFDRSDGIYDRDTGDVVTTRTVRGDACVYTVITLPWASAHRMTGGSP